MLCSGLVVARSFFCFRRQPGKSPQNVKTTSRIVFLADKDEQSQPGIDSALSQQCPTISFFCLSDFERGPMSATLENDSQYRTNLFYGETLTTEGWPEELVQESREEQSVSSQCRKFMLWIDGVGGWQLCTGSSFVIGAPSLEKESADIALLANVSRQHALLSCEGEEWRLTAHHPTHVAGKLIESDTAIRSGDQICMAERVRLGFRIPSVLSTAAVIDFESDHRPSYSVDGIILLTDHCLLGPRRDHHIFCNDWPDLVVLFEQDGELRCRSNSTLHADGEVIRDSAPLSHGTVITGEDLRFRVEQMD